MSLDVFIGFSRQDIGAADKTCEALEAAGIRCWMVHRDIVPGRNYLEAIQETVDHCRAVLLILSSNTSNANTYVLERAAQRGVPIIWLMKDNAAPAAEFATFRELARVIDASSPPFEMHLRRLTADIKPVLRQHSEGEPHAFPTLAERRQPVEQGSGELSLDELALLRERAGPLAVGLPQNALLVPMASARLYQPLSATPTSPDWVDVSAFAPKSAHHGQKVLVQIYVHTLDQPQAVRKRSYGADRATRRDVTTLATRVVRGQIVTVILDAPGVFVDDPTKQIEWTGQPRACRFLLTLPKLEHDKEYVIRIRIVIESIPKGKLAFKLPASSGTGRDKADLVGTATDYKRLFLSYASEDLAKVLQCAPVLKSAGLTYFQDLLKPREKWEKRLLVEEIDQCQLFLLFWSSNAAKSARVIREAEYALYRQTTKGAGESPEIAPVILESPPVPPPPESLKRIHFNDPIRYVIAAVEAMQSRPN